jgi:hypothetical protein
MPVPLDWMMLQPTTRPDLSIVSQVSTLPCAPVPRASAG